MLRGPDPERDGRSSWTANDFCRLVETRFGVAYSENGMLRLLHDLGLSWQKTRPVHPQADPKAQETFKPVFPGCGGISVTLSAGSGRYFRAIAASERAQNGRRDG